MALFLDKHFSSVALGHLVVDVMNGIRGVLLAFWSGPLGLSNSNIGLISALFAFTGSLVQPIFGYITDRFGARWVAAGGILWMGFFVALAVTVPGQIAIVFFVVAGLGSGAFHPAGAAQATLAGRTGYAGRETAAASYFFLFGQSGFFVGPALGGALLDAFKAPGLLILAAAAVPAGIFAAFALRSAPIEQHFPENTKTGPRPKLEFLPVIALVIVGAFQSWTQSNVITFMPKYLSDLGQPASLYGFLTALFMGGSAIGNVIGGHMADRFGKTRVILISMTLAVVSMFFLARAEVSWYYVWVPLSGGLTGASFPVIIVLAQRIVPVGTGLASGLIMGFCYSAGAIGAWLSGALADQAGIPTVFMLSAGICLVSALVAPLIHEGHPGAAAV